MKKSEIMGLSDEELCITAKNVIDAILKGSTVAFDVQRGNDFYRSATRIFLLSTIGEGVPEDK